MRQITLNSLRAAIDELYARTARTLSGLVETVTGSAPIVVTGTPTHPNVAIAPATDLAAGSLSAADKTKLDGLAAGGGATANASWSQADWYVSWATGNDANAGTIGAPVKTVSGGIVPKWGTPSPTLAQTTRIRALDSQPVGAENAVLSPILVGGNNLIILGTLAAQGAAFAAGAVTAKAPGTPGVLLQVAGFTHGETAGMLVHNVTRGSYAIIDSVTGPGVATMQQPWVDAGVTTVIPFPTLVEDNGWAPGNSLQVSILPRLNLKVLSPQGGDSNAGFTVPVCWTQWVHLPDVSGVPGNSVFSPNPNGVGLAFSLCWFDPYLFGGVPEVGGGGAFFIGCHMNGSGAFAGSASVFCNIVGGALNTSTNEPMYFSGSGIIIDGDTILHGTVAPTKSNCAFYGSQNYVQAYMDANILMAARYGGVLVIQDVYGYGPGVGHPVLWGAGTLDTEAANGAIFLETGDTWANSLTVGTLHLDGATTGTKYVAGTFTDGVVLTVANLDLFHGLQHPLTGSRYAGG